MKTMNFSKRVVMVAMVAFAAMFGTQAMAQTSKTGDLVVKQDMTLTTGSYSFNSVKVENGAELTICPSAVVNVSHLDVDDGATVSNNGFMCITHCFFNEGEFYNNGKVQAKGDFVNSEMLENNGSLIVTSDLQNTGVMGNQGSMQVTGTINNYFVCNLGQAIYGAYNNDSNF